MPASAELYAGRIPVIWVRCSTDEPNVVGRENLTELLDQLPVRDDPQAVRLQRNTFAGGV